MPSAPLAIVAFAVTLLAVATWAQDDFELPYGTVMERHSFRSPFNNNFIPSFELGAGARIEDGAYVRITPARQSRMGYLWNNIANTAPDWEATIVFRAHGQPALGGDGFAFWYVSRPKLLGHVYGGSDYWDGLGVFFDTFNNDGRGDSSTISAVVNDGSLAYDQNTDGVSQAAGSCGAPFRNSEAWSIAKITYQHRTLSVAIDAKGEGKYTTCFSSVEVDVGVDKYFGITAGTGDLADNHDIQSITIKTLTAAGTDVAAIRARFGHAHDHSHMATKDAPLDDETFQNEALRMLNQILSATSQLEMSQVGLANLLSNVDNRAPQAWQQQQQQQQQQVPYGGGGSSSDELRAVSTNVNSLLSRLSDMASSRTGPSIARLTESINKIDAQLTMQAGGGGQAMNQQFEAVKAEIRSNMRALVTEARTHGSGGGDDGGSWLGSILTFIAGLAVGAVIAWYTFRASRSSAYKLP